LESYLKSILVKTKKDTHHAKGQFNPNPINKKTVTAFRYPEHADSGNMKFKIGQIDRKKLVDGAPTTYFKCSGVSKSSYGFFVMGFGF
jgi:hypothetical protein